MGVGGPSDCGRQLVRRCPALAARKAPEAAGRPPRGRKLQGYGGTPGVENGAQTAAKAAARCIECRVALHNGDAVAIYWKSGGGREFIPPE